MEMQKQFDQAHHGREYALDVEHKQDKILGDYGRSTMASTTFAFFFHFYYNLCTDLSVYLPEVFLGVWHETYASR